MNDSFDELLSIAQEPMRPIMLAIRELIIRIHPETCEVIRIGDRAASYGIGPKKMSEAYCYIIPHKSWVNLGFYRGAHLSDPTGILEGTGKNMRHVKIRDLHGFGQSAIQALIEVAIQEQRTMLGV